MRAVLWSILVSVVFVLVAAPAAARVVALGIDLPLDQIGPGRPFKVGDHHHARVYYDDSKIDRRTHIVRVLHMQHWVESAGWVPARLDAVAMPMTDAWLDLSRTPYRYHYSSAVLEGGEPVYVDFDEHAQRMTVRLQSDRSVVVSAPYVVDASPVAGLDTDALFLRPPAYIMHEMDVAIDQVAPGERSTVGSHDSLHLVYDYSELNPATGRVRLKNMQHFIMGKFLPEHPDAEFMPVTDAWLDLRASPYALHFKARVTHGKPIIIEADERTRRLTIHPTANPDAVLLSGHYRIDPRPITGPQVVAAATPAPPASPGSAAAAGPPP